MASEIRAKIRLGMPSTRRSPNTVASQATDGAMKICEPMPAVESHAPSSKPSENAPRRSGNPTVVRRLSKLARKAPSSTAATANSGRGPTLPRDTGPRSSSLAAIAGINPGDDGHSRQQAIEQCLVLVECDTNRDALHDLGEIAGRVIRRQQGRLRATRRRDALDAPAQRLLRETVDRDFDRLARLHMGELRFLVVRDHMDVRQRHDIDEVGADIDVIAGLHLTLAGDAVERRDDPGVAEFKLCRRK